MKLKRALSIVSLVIGAGVWVVGEPQADTAAADASRLFREGKFSEAERACASLLRKDRNNFQALLLRGRIALFGNRLIDAHKWLNTAAGLKPNEKEPKSLLAEIFYRRDEFQKAVPLLREAGKEVMARQMESFKGLVPYRIEGKRRVARLRFSHTDPLPLVSIRVNGEEANVIIDTGGSELILDTEFGKKVGVISFGREVRTFGGGSRAPVELGRADSVALGEVEVRNVPVHVMSTRAFAAAARGKPVGGVLGTVLLYHFLATLDYPGGQLILEPRTKGSLSQLERTAKTDGQGTIPFWMAGDHFIVAWGRVNQSAPALFFVDTGLAGAGFTCPRSILDEAGIKLSEERAGEGIGGGGRVRIVPFEIDELALGNATERKLRGFFGPFPESLEYSLGFRIGGIISHQFFRSYALTFDFDGMRLFLKRV